MATLEKNINIKTFVFYIDGYNTSAYLNFDLYSRANKKLFSTLWFSGRPNILKHSSMEFYML